MLYAHCDDDDDDDNNKKKNSNNNNNNNNKHFSDSPQSSASGSFSQTWINFVERRLKFFHIEGSIVS